MADPVVPPIIKKNYGERLTLDLDTSLPMTTPEGCLSLKNVIRRNRRGLSKRPGTRMIGSDEPSAVTSSNNLVATHFYEYINSSGKSVEERLFFSRRSALNLHPETAGSIAVNYGGAGTASVSILVNASNLWEVTLYVNNAAISGWPKTYGNGITSAAGIRISQLVSDIDAEASWTATDSSAVTARSTVAQIGSMVKTDLVPASTPDLSIPYTYPGPAVAAAGGVGLLYGIDYIDWVNIRGINIDNCALLPLGGTDGVASAPTPVKWDGQSLYRPGLPRAEIQGISDTGSGTSHAADSQYLYRIGFWRVDNRGNQIYGPYSDDSLPIAQWTVGGSATDVTLVFYPLTSASLDRYGGSKWDARTARVNGNQVAVTTITVDAAHGLQIGDVAYFLNRATSLYVEKTLTGRTNTTITFAGAVTVNTLDIISNIRVQIQRSENQGIDFFEVENIPNDGRSSVTTQTYIDSTTDGSLGSSIEDQIKLPEPMPPADIVCIHQGLVVAASLFNDPNGFTWNDPEWGHEAFPSATNRDRVPGSGGKRITAMVSESDTTLGVFKERAYYRVQGDLAAGQYIITQASDNLGISSHTSLVKYKDLVYGISPDGPVVIQDGIITLEVGAGVLDFFEGNEYTVPQADGVTISTADSAKLVPMRSTAAYWREAKCLVFFIPAESGRPEISSDGGTTSDGDIDRYANANSLWLCYDLALREWREWEFANANINAHLAMETMGDTLYFISSNPAPAGTATYSARNFAWKFLSAADILSYTDNTDPIEWQPRLQWESLGLPSSEKKMTEIKLYMRHASDFLASFDLDVREYQNGNDSTLYTQASRTFSASTDREKIIEAIPGSFESNSIEFYNNELYQCPVLSGFEVAYRITAPPEIKDTKGDV